MAPPNYRPAERCCATCNEGHGSGISAGYYCSWHNRMPVSRHCVCDDWQQEADPGQTDDQEIRIFKDGDQWCALRGPDLQEGESGFGLTPEEALMYLIGQTDAAGVSE